MAAGKVRVASLPDSFLAHGRPGDILAEHRLDAAGLAARVRAEVEVRAEKAAG